MRKVATFLGLYCLVTAVILGASFLFLAYPFSTTTPCQPGSIRDAAIDCGQSNLWRSVKVNLLAMISDNQPMILNAHLSHNLECERYTDNDERSLQVPPFKLNSDLILLKSYIDNRDGRLCLVIGDPMSSGGIILNKKE